MKKIFEAEGKKSVLFVFGNKTYIVPIDTARELKLSSYDGEQLNGEESFFDQIRTFEIEHINTYAEKNRIL